MNNISRSKIFNIKRVNLHYSDNPRNKDKDFFRITTNDGIQMCLLPRNVLEHFKIYRVWWQFRDVYIPNEDRLLSS